ncbi:MAG TPA: hypothetical protein VFA18_16515 [Gemmataceae bacterium]|nr:hypothetical protein [Gemmataceae bacterium]
MNAAEAARSLEVIRTLMERMTQYQLLTARAGLVAGSLAGVGALSFLFLDVHNPWQFGVVWGIVFVGSLLATSLSTVLRSREQGERVWSRPARAVVRALAPSLFAALVLSVYFFARGGEEYLWLPGIWLLCYGQGALATAAYAPAPIRSLGVLALLLGAVTVALGPEWAVPMMGLTFGLGHIVLGLVLLVRERKQRAIRLHRSVA